MNDELQRRLRGRGVCLEERSVSYMASMILGIVAIFLVCIALIGLISCAIWQLIINLRNRKSVH